MRGSLWGRGLVAVGGALGGRVMVGGGGRGRTYVRSRIGSCIANQARRSYNELISQWRRDYWLELRRCARYRPFDPSTLELDHEGLPFLRHRPVLLLLVFSGFGLVRLSDGRRYDLLISSGRRYLVQLP